MYWLDEIKIRLKKKNQVLFAKNSEFLQDFVRLFQGQDHRVLTLWAFDFAAESIAALQEKYPGEKRPEAALEAARGWAAGTVRMPVAQRKKLDCHAFAKDIDEKADIAACHAIGQACSVVHTAGHAIGYPIYDLTSIVYRLGPDSCAQAVLARKQSYTDRFFYWKEHLSSYQGEWAAFMLK